MIVIDDYFAARELEHDFRSIETFDVQVSARLSQAEGAELVQQSNVTALLIAEHCAYGCLDRLRQAGVTCPVFVLVGELTRGRRERLLATGFAEVVALTELSEEVVESVVLLALQLQRKRSRATAKKSGR